MSALMHESVGLAEFKHATVLLLYYQNSDHGIQGKPSLSESHKADAASVYLHVGTPQEAW